MRKVVVVQARMGSSRLPGKVLMDLDGKPVVDHVLGRASAIPGIAEVCLATSIDPLNDELAESVSKSGYRVVRGSEQDVLGRFMLAVSETGADAIMRVTADCPLLDPQVCGDVLALLDGKETPYASNVEKAEWPHGLDCEAVTAEALAPSDRSTQAADEREHVTLWIRRHKDLRRAYLPGPGGAVAEQRWVVDYPEDLAMLRELMPLLRPLGPMPGWRDIARVCEENPGLGKMNARDVAAANRYTAAIEGEKP